MRMPCPAISRPTPGPRLSPATRTAPCRPQGGVQLFDPATAAAYGEYLKTLAAHLKEAGLYDAIAAIHLELGDAAELPENVDYSDITRAHWQQFLQERYQEVAAFNRATGMTHAAWEDVPIPVRGVPARATPDWEEFLAVRWRRHLTQKFKKDRCAERSRGHEVSVVR